MTIDLIIRKQRAYYDNLWSKTEREDNILDIGWNYEKRRIDSAILSLISKLSATRNHAKILEIGLGKGDFALKISSQINMTETSYFGMDLSREGIKITYHKLRNSDFHFLIADAIHLPYRLGIFDIMVCSEVIEHIIDKEGLLREMKLMLKDAGWLILTTPNPNALIYFIPKLLRNIFKQYRSGLLHAPINEFVEPYRLWFLLEKSDFEIVYRSGLVLSSYIASFIEQFLRMPLTPLRKIFECLEKKKFFVDLTLYQVIYARSRKI